MAPSQINIQHNQSASKSRNTQFPHREPPPKLAFDWKPAFYLFLLSNTIAAAYAPIQDCDEVFNYWEPAHYLSHGYGLQTWEYSPEYAIRSWTYVGIHSLVAKMGSILSHSKTAEFYFLRLILAAACAGCETRLFSVISRILNPRIGVLFLVIMAFSPGMMHASVAFLPSSFTMYTSMLGVASFMDWHGGSKSAAGILWFGIGGLIGWPFAAALVLPFLGEEIAIAAYVREFGDITRRFLDGAMRSLIALAVQAAIELFFYHKLVIVPWRIVLYNVFGGKNRGPDIFGTEPWHFYLRNLLLNFNIWFLLALAAAPLLALQWFFRSQATTKQTVLRTIVLIIPFYMWLTIFSLQPHKEERFMYPAYPFLGLNSAITVHMILVYVGSSDRTTIVGRIPTKVKLFVAVFSMVLAVDIGILRTIGVVSSYNAPLKVYRALEQNALATAGDTVCLGKEWYRFPSSYFLPNGMHVKFIKSEFNGLLPGEFSEAEVGFGLFPGTWLVPAGMNDRNIGDPGKYTDIEHCSFLVDSYFPSSEASALEPHYILDRSTWKELSCHSYLDTTSTNIIGRILWIPDLPIIPPRFRRKWGEYCLLERRKAAPE